MNCSKLSFIIIIDAAGAPGTLGTLMTWIFEGTTARSHRRSGFGFTDRQIESGRMADGGSQSIYWRAAREKVTEIGLNGCMTLTI